ncbi:hypothetical protein BGX27_006739 [Mortierella sp. AM989]|nr:hypothetical protein BGX27_006739 [Mortierella sp. AM989]
MTSKSHPYREEDLYRIDTLSVKQAPRTKDTKRSEAYKDFDDVEKSSLSTGGVPSWFGSLRSFAISASSNSKGAFTSLATSKTGSPILSHTPSRGRSSSIYYAGSLKSDDSDSDYNSEAYDEPITDKNGLKENRVRGPRISWAMLDPSLGGLFPASYKAVSESEAELSSPTCSSSVSSLHSPTIASVEDLGISEAPYRDNDSGDDADDGGNELSKYEPYSNTAAIAYPTSTAPSPTSSAFSLIKSYVPSLPSFNDSNSGPAGTTQRTGTESGASSEAGFWSIRNLLSSNQYRTADSSSSEDVHCEGADLTSVSEKPYKDEASDNNERCSTPPGSGSNASSPMSSYFSSMLSSATISKESQLISTQVRDNLEQLPISSKSIKKIGRTD